MIQTINIQHQFGRAILEVNEDAEITIVKSIKVDPPVRSPQRGHNNGCGGIKIVRWLGIRWWDMPYPERLVWWIYSGFTVPPSSWPGCGCIVKLKAAWQGMKWWWKVVKNA